MTSINNDKQSSNHINIPHTEWRIYPPSKASFANGDEVFIRPKSNNERGKIGQVVVLQQKGQQQDVEEVIDEVPGGKKNVKRIAVDLNFVEDLTVADGARAGASKKQSEGDFDENAFEDTNLQTSLCTSSCMEPPNGDSLRSSPPLRTFRMVKLIKRYRRSNIASRSKDCLLSKNPLQMQLLQKQQNAHDKCHVIITAQTNHFRNFATSQIQTPPSITTKTTATNAQTTYTTTTTTRKDIVLEIGCSNGECSSTIAPYCKHFIGFDTSKQMIEEANKKMKLRTKHQLIRKSKLDKKKEEYTNDDSGSATGRRGKGGRDISDFDENGVKDDDNNDDEKTITNYEFHTIDPFLDPNRAKEIAKDVNVVLIDIGGNREMESVLFMIQWVLQSLSYVTMIIVKSEAMVDCICRKALILGKDNDWNGEKVESDNNVGQQKGRSCENNAHDDNTQSFTTDCEHSANQKSEIVPSYQMSIQPNDGLITNCQTWYLQTLQTAKEQNLFRKTRRHEDVRGPPKYLHPLKAPMVLSPRDNMTPICRYHNYYKGNGCDCSDRCKYKEDCPFDHEYCHWCLQKGHIALDCTYAGLLDP